MGIGHGALESGSK